MRLIRLLEKCLNGYYPQYRCRVSDENFGNYTIDTLILQIGIGTRIRFICLDDEISMLWGVLSTNLTDDVLRTMVKNSFNPFSLHSRNIDLEDPAFFEIIDEAIANARRQTGLDDLEAKAKAHVDKVDAEIARLQI